jgi:hypothetical protein
VKLEALAAVEWLATVAGGIGKDVRGMFAPDGVVLCVESFCELPELHAAQATSEITTNVSNSIRERADCFRFRKLNCILRNS